jgi:hypothetical protein
VASFYARYEKALRVSAGPAVTGGRLQGAAAVSLADLSNAGDTRAAAAPFELFGPGDVQRLAATAITRRFPTPGASDAEETKLALVEFAAADLPWRYTPAAATGAVLRPWLVLLVGHRSPDEIVLRPDGRVTLGTVTQAGHKLVDSWQWAHVHQVDGPPIARILAPLKLAPDDDYVACLVPAFTATGADSWDGSAPATCDCYDLWAFRTGPLGDFPELAAKLHKADLAAIDAASGKPFGRADVVYQPRTPGAQATTRAAAGALRLPPSPAPAPDPADDAFPPAIGDEVAALTLRVLTPDGRGFVSAPRYDAPFGDPNAAPDPIPGGWVEELTRDPRLRGAAGIGSWNAIEWQDRISLAAATKAGDLAIADDRVRHVALGVEASRSLWRRRMPPMPPDAGADPAATLSAAADRLAVLSPILGRLPSTTGNTVLDDVAGRSPQLDRALLSSAARRALRPGPARAALAQEGAQRLGAVLSAANTCPPAKRDAADIRSGGGNPAAAVKNAVVAAARDDNLASRILDRLGDHPSLGQLVAALRALTPGRDGKPDAAAIEKFLEGGEFPDPGVVLASWPGWMRELAPPEPCRPLDLAGLSNAVAAAVDPTIDRPPAVQRVLSTLPGFTHVGPVEIEPELDLPLWSFLSQRSPDWMLPGAGDLAQHTVVGLSTNPRFVEALLVGANHQTASELRWRNIPMVTRWSPLRKFWQRTGGEFDIVPIKTWPDADALGSATLDDGHGSEAVVAFRTPLFRRYPSTVVYLYPASADWQPPAENVPLAAPDRKDPTFSGTIGDDVTFFGFAVPPADLATHWVVLEEPPAGYRFYHQQDAPPPWPGKPDDNSANFAYNRFAQPVRVLIGPLL